MFILIFLTKPFCRNRLHFNLFSAQLAYSTCNGIQQQISRSFLVAEHLGLKTEHDAVLSHFKGFIHKCLSFKINLYISRAGECSMPLHPWETPSPRLCR